MARVGGRKGADGIALERVAIDPLLLAAEAIQLGVDHVIAAKRQIALYRWSNVRPTVVLLMNRTVLAFGTAP